LGVGRRISTLGRIALLQISAPQQAKCAHLSFRSLSWSRPRPSRRLLACRGVRCVFRLANQQDEPPPPQIPLFAPCENSPFWRRSARERKRELSSSGGSAFLWTDSTGWPRPMATALSWRTEKRYFDFPSPLRRHRIVDRSLLLAPAHFLSNRCGTGEIVAGTDRLSSSLSRRRQHHCSGSGSSGSGSGSGSGDSKIPCSVPMVEWWLIGEELQSSPPIAEAAAGWRKGSAAINRRCCTRQKCDWFATYSSSNSSSSSSSCQQPPPNPHSSPLLLYFSLNCPQFNSLTPPFPPKKNTHNPPSSRCR
jgi:hypothetical protein